VIAAPQPVDATERAQPETKIKAGTIGQLFGAAVKALTVRAPKPAPPKKRRRSGDDDKGRAGILLPRAVPRTTVNFRRMARDGFRQAKAIIRHQPFTRQQPATTSEDHFWFHHWQNSTGTVADTGPDCGPANHLSPHL
jgi:hypothetical protein